MRFLIAASLAAALAACGSDNPTPPPPPPPTASTVTVTTAAQSIAVGATTQLTAVVLTNAGTVLSGAPIAWASDNPSIATVDSSGVVIGRAAGTVNIRASSGTATGAIGITVTPAPVATVTVRPDTLTIGDTRGLAAIVRDANGNELTGRSVSFTSSDTAVAVVRGGTLTAISSGTITITATAEGKTGAAAFVVVHGALPKLALQLLADGMDGRFITAPIGDSRQFFATADGRIWIIQNDRILPDPYLDISAKVNQGGNGVYSIAFHPRYATNGFVYIDYVDHNLQTQVERYTVSSDPNRANPASALPIITINHPPPFDHYGGSMAFGPDGKLFITAGDGGPGNSENAQDKTLLLGKVLRLDVDGGTPYAILADNPFANGVGGRREIWAYGLRNPFRGSFDRVTGALWIADVGQDDWEEVDMVRSTRAGADYGWNKLEGSHCSPVSTTGCSDPGSVLPVLEYTHPGRPAAAGATHPTGCSVTGGYVYRGNRIPALRGMYFYGDFCAGWVRSFRLENGIVVDQQRWFDNIGSIIAFSEDAAGELYVMTLEGKTYRITAP